MLNRVTLIGRLTADPEVQSTQSGIPRATFRLAVDRQFRNQQGERETDFIPIVCWRKLAETVGQYMKKGRLVAVEGRLQSRRYQTEDGQNRTMYDVVADAVHFLESRGSGSGSTEYAAPSESDAPPARRAADNPPSYDDGPPEPEGDDLPF